MKFVAKHLSKKALSCILALAVVLCSISAVFSVFANVETADSYTITYSSPLIPMYVNKMVNLVDVEIQLEKGGEAVAATTLTWAAPENDGIIFAGNKIIALSAGTYKFTVTDAEDNEYPVYVIANEAGDETFELVSRNFANAADRITSEWMVGKAPSTNGHDASTRNVHKYGGVGTFDTTNKCLNLTLVSYNGTTAIFKSDILKDFADYTVDAKIEVRNSGGSIMDRTAVGILTRVQANYDAATVDTDYVFNQETSPSALGVGFRPYGGAHFYYFESTGGGNNNYTSYTNRSFADVTTSDSDYVFGGYYTGTASSPNDVTIKAAGTDVGYWLNGNMVLDTTAADSFTQVTTTNSGSYPDTDTSAYTSSTVTKDTFNSSVAGRFCTDRGTIGFYLSRVAALRVYSFTVSANVTSMPKMSDPDFYIVTDSNPVIPMTAGYKLSTSDFMISVNDKCYLASAFSWTGGSNTTAEIKDGYLYSYSKGGTVLTGTLTANEEITAKLYVVAKEAGETEYTVYSNDYRSTLSETDVSDWKTVIVNKNDADTEIAVSGNYAAEQNLKGFVPYNYDTIKADSDLSSNTSPDANQANRAYTLLDNEIVNSLTDYKITASFRMYSGNRGAIGVVGRVSNTTDGKYTAGNSKTYGFVNGTNGSYASGFKKVNTISANTIAESTNISTDLSNYLYTSINTTAYEYRTFVLEFKSETATLSAPGIEGTATLEAPAQAGQVGFVAMFTSTDYKATPILMDFAVTLTNVDDEAVAAKLVSNDTEVVKKTGGYVDNRNYCFYVSPNNKNGLYTSTDNGDYGYFITDANVPKSEKVVLPSTNVQVYDTTEYSDAVRYTGQFLFGAEDLTTRQSVGEIVVSEGYKYISGHSFKNMSFLEKFTVPSTIVEVGDTAFNNSGLTEIILPDATTTIANNAFKGCNSLRKVELGNGVTSIGNNAFQNCKVLQKIVLPASCNSIGSSAFDGDIMLTDMYVYNPEMTFGTTSVPTTTTIHGYIGSTAHIYAIQNGNEFVALDTVTVNSRIELPEIDGFTWNSSESSIGAVVVGDTAATVVGLSKGELTVEGNYNETTEITFTVNVEAYDSTNENNFINTDKITIVPTTESGIYNIVIADDVNLKHDEFIIDGKVAYLNETAEKTGKEYLLYTVADETGKNKQYSLATIEIAAKFEADATYSSAIYALGATVPTDENDVAIRFVNRITSITANGEVGALKAEITVNGTAVKPVAVGSLVIPTMLINSNVNNLVLPEDKLASYIVDAPTQVSVGDGTYSAANVAITKLNDATADYSDYVVKLKSIGNMTETDITCRSYIIYQNTDESYGIIYDADITRSYSQVSASANAQ